MPEDEKTEVAGGEQLPAEILTCEDAKKEIHRLIDERQKIENELLDKFDKKRFREKKQIDRTIRELFQDYSVCSIPEEPLETLEEPAPPEKPA